MSYLTTHILDTMHGQPAAEVAVTLFRIQKDKRIQLNSTTTNKDGRCDSPLLQEADFSCGQYELIFSIGNYFERLGVILPEPRFLDDIVIRFGVNDPKSHYHVPLLVTPFSYSTYRGS